MRESVRYEELVPQAFRHRLAHAPIAYLPLGTLEWHGEHLPLGADGLQSHGFFERLAREVGGIVLPMLFLGPDRHVDHEGRDMYGMDVFGFTEGEPQQLAGSAYWIDSDLYVAIVDATLKQLARAGFRIVVAHGHGPSTYQFRDHIEEWESRYGLRLFICWREDESDGLGIQTDHAAANETSLVMALHPDLVRMDLLPKDPDDWPVAVGGEDPRAHASADRGEKAITLQSERMADLLRGVLAELA